MKLKYISIWGLVAMLGCTKLDQSLQDSVTNSSANTDTKALLNAAYNSMNALMHGQDQLFSLQEVTTDEALVPTRGGDWDDNGVWRVLHAHTWNADHGQLLTVFNNLNKLNYDATVVLGFKPSAQQEGEARFLRAMACYYLMDFFGQFSV